MWGSSEKYKTFIEGKANNNKINPGDTVQNNSNSWLSKNMLSKANKKKEEKIKYPLIKQTKITKIIEKSWKKLILSISGENLSWKDKVFQIGIKFKNYT